MNSRFGFLTLAAGLACSMVLSGCARTADAPRTAPPEVTVILESSTPSLNPYSPALAQRRIGRLIFQGLFTVDDAGMPLPDLCAEVPTRENGGISADGRTVRFTLAQAKFHDGRPVTAADVVFTIDLLRAGKLVDEPGIDLSRIVSARALDARTVEVRFDRPDAPLAWHLAPFVLPAHLLSSSADLLSDPYWSKPVGSGPYRVSSVRPGASVRLVDATSGDGPILDAAFVPDQSAGRAIYDDAPYAVWVDAPVGVAGASESQLATDSAVWWRLCASSAGDSVAEDPSVRWAVRSLVESQWATETAEKETAPFGYRPKSSPSQVTTEQVATRLADSGWISGSEGVREKAGRPLEVTVRTPGLDIAQGRLWDAVSAAAADVGMSLSVRPSGPDYYGDYLEGGVLSRDEGDFFLTALAVGAPPGYAWPFDPRDIPSFKNPNGLNWQRIANARARGWTVRIRSAKTPDDAARTLRAAWARLDRTNQVVWLYPAKERVLVKRVTGVTVHPFAEMALTDSLQWRVSK